MRSLLTLILLVCFAIIPSSAMQDKGGQTQAPDKGAQAKAPDKGVPTLRVWVDTLYGFYHCSTSKLYGKTRQGVYMMQKQAQDRGYRPAYGTVCNTPPPAKPKPKAPTKK